MIKKTTKTETTYHKGAYSDHDIIQLLNKLMLKNQLVGIKIHVFKEIGKKVQSALTLNDLSHSEILSIIQNVIDNPPAPPLVPVLIKPSKEELELERLKIRDEQNKFTSKMIDGKEVLIFSKEGMNNLNQNDNPLFEDVGKSSMYDHEDDGRIYKTQKVKRLTDGKMFSYHFIWHAEWDNDYWDNTLEES